MEPQFAMALRGIGQPAVQILAGINMQLKTGRKKKKKKKKKADEAAVLMNQLAAEQHLRTQMR
jgi:hypothetical protein